jgi:hypothetical protein
MCAVVALFCFAIYCYVLFMLVWYYFDKAHSESVDYYINLAHVKTMQSVYAGPGKFTTIAWTSYDMWYKTRGFFLS